MEDCIIISQMKVLARIGVTELERTLPQRLTVSLWLTPSRPVLALVDELENTVDYAAVCEAVRTEAEARTRKLIETLAEDTAAVLLGRFPLRSVEVEVRKYILPDTEYTAVRIVRARAT